MPQHDHPTPEEIAKWRAMSGVERLKLASDLWWAERRRKAEEIKSQHPDWSDELVEMEVRRIYFEAALKQST